MDNPYFPPTQTYDYLGYTTTTNPNLNPQPQQIDGQFQAYPAYPVYEAVSSLPSQESHSGSSDQQYASPITANTSRQSTHISQSHSNQSLDDADQLHTEESAEEKESFDDAQARRKAQNRAAQRAFRERKETHLKELERKVEFLEAENKTITQENRTLQNEVQKFSTEVKILRATSAVNPAPEVGTLEVGPMHFSPTDFVAQFSHTFDKDAKRASVVERSETNMLSGIALWNKITTHPAFKEGLIDLPLLIENLKQTAECDGLGPCFPEDKVDEALERAATLGDEL